MGASSSNDSEWNIDEKWSSQEDDDMDSDTDAELDMSLSSRSFLHRVNDRVRKIQDQSSKDATQDSNKHSLIW